MSIASSETSPSTVQTESGLIRAHGLASLAMLLYVMLLGLVIALKMQIPGLLGSQDWLTWGRLRNAHTQGMFFGWLGNAFLAFCYYAVPRLTERRVTSRGLGWLLFLLWNFALVIPGWVLLHRGISQGLELAEFPLVMDGVAQVCFLLTGLQFAIPFLRTRLADLYVSGWYILGGLVFTFLAYPMGNLIPELEPGARGASYSGLWIHDAVGLYVTPLALAIAYIVIPASTGRPIFSHFLSMVGFWLLFLVYPLNGTHHYVFSSIPMEAQRAAVVASIYLGVDVILVVTNLLLSLRGSTTLVASQPSLRYVWMGIVLYLVVSLQGSLQAIMPVNRFVHFSDWVIGHSHLAMIGFASFLAIGGLLHVWQRTPGVRYNPRAADWSFWLLNIGLALMVVDLTVAGLVQAQVWESEAAWLESVRASKIYWHLRTLSGIVLLLGLFALFASMLTGARRLPVSSPIETPAPEQLIGDAPGTPPALLAWLRTAYGVMAIAGVGFFLVSFLVLAVWPNQVVQETIDSTRPRMARLRTQAEEHGRHIYIREGCANCHSQLIRFTEADVRRFGIASQAWESDQDYPQLWGTRRIGPDLSREYGRRSQDWQLAHLYQPRAIVNDSIMPAYPWLFEGSISRPTSEALDLVAYLESLGRDAAIAGRSGPQPLPSIDPEEEKRRNMFCDCSIPRTAGPVPILNVLNLEPGEEARLARRGEELFARHCAGCHGTGGGGDGPAAEALIPRPRDLRAVQHSDRSLSRTLWQGRKGSSMPAWNELTLGELRALDGYVQTLASRTATAPPAEISPDELIQAQGLYSQNCQNCHGVVGNRSTAPSPLAPAATRFAEVRPAEDYAETVLAEGIIGSAMSSWKTKLTEAQRKLLARYIRTLYREDS